MLLLALTGCVILKQQAIKEGHGMAVIPDSFAEGWKGDIYLRSYNYSSNDDIKLKQESKKFKLLRHKINTTSHSNVDLYIDEALEHCIINKKDDIDKLIKMVNHPIHLKKILSFKLSLFIVNGGYDFKEILKKEEPLSVKFYSLAKTCDDIIDSIFNGYATALHEVGHIYFLKNNLLKKYTPAQNEFWATKISYCSYINNPSVEYIFINDITLNSKEKRMYNSNSLKFGIKATEIGAKKVHEKLYSLANTTKLNSKNENINEIKKWCKQMPI